MGVAVVVGILWKEVLDPEGTNEGEECILSFHFHFISRDDGTIPLESIFWFLFLSWASGRAFGRYIYVWSGLSRCLYCYIGGFLWALEGVAGSLLVDISFIS